MYFFDENTLLKKKINSLPQSIRNEIIENKAEIKSIDELNELVRRIQSAKSGRIF